MRGQVPDRRAGRSWSGVRAAFAHIPDTYDPLSRLSVATREAEHDRTSGKSRERHPLPFLVGAPHDLEPPDSPVFMPFWIRNPEL